MRRHLKRLCALLFLCLVAGPASAQGVIPADPLRYAALPRARKAPAGPLPRAIDLSRDMPVPGDQGGQFSCTAWALAYATKSFNEHLRRRWGYSPDHTFSPAYIYNPLVAGNCTSGILVETALASLRDGGVASLKQFPYDVASCARQPTALERAAALSYAIATWGVVPRDITEIKLQLQRNTPVIVATLLDRSFATLKATGSVYHWTAPLDGGYHAMVIVGYDDDRGAFKLENSYGTAWGDGGFFWLGYDDAMTGIQELYSIEELPMGPGAVAASGPTLLLFVASSELALGTVSRSLTTDNNHCAANCQGEPTRRNYVITLQADPGTELRNPVCKCVAGRCDGWNQLHFAQLEGGGQRAVASFDTWGTPTTWVLTAQAFRVRRETVSTSARVGGVIELAGRVSSTPEAIASETTDGLVRVSPTDETRERLEFVGSEAGPLVTYFKFKVLK